MRGWGGGGQNIKKLKVGRPGYTTGDTIFLLSLVVLILNTGPTVQRPLTPHTEPM